jgi:hypothetical protein
LGLPGAIIAFGKLNLCRKGAAKKTLRLAGGFPAIRAGAQGQAIVRRSGSAKSEELTRAIAFGHRHRWERDNCFHYANVWFAHTLSVPAAPEAVPELGLFSILMRNEE